MASIARSANERVRSVLVVGCGYIGTRHVVAFSSLQGMSVSICDQDRTRLSGLTDALAVVGTYPSLEAALERSWDAVVIATPVPSHLPLGKMATSAGVPVLVEKPLALRPDGVDDWIDLAAEKQVPVMVAYPFRCHPLAVALKDRITSAAIGRPLQVVSVRGAHLPTRRPDYAQTYYRSTDTGGGIVHDILSHTLNLSEWLFGRTERVVADAEHVSLPLVDVPDTIHVLARHRNVMAVHAIAQHHHVASLTYAVHGTEGSLLADFASGRLFQSTAPDEEWATSEVFQMSAEGWMKRQALCFVDVVAQKVGPPCGLSDGLHTVRSVGACLESTEAGGWVDVEVPS